MDIAKLVVEVSTKGAKEATSDIEKLGKSAGNTEKSVTSLSKGMSGLGTVFSVVAIASVAKEYAKISDTMTLLEARIKLVTKAGENLTKVQQDLFNVAQQNRVAYDAVGNLYAKIVQPLNKLGYSTQNAINITDAFSKSLLISGASIEESNSAIRQFSQAMASGVLRGDEFNSMAENAPAIMNALGDALGKTAGELRQMAHDGKLTADVVAGALVDSLGTLTEKANKIPLTVGGAFQRVGNELALSVDNFNKATGASSAFAETIDTLAKSLNEANKSIFKSSEELDKLEKSANIKLKEDGILASILKVNQGVGEALYNTLAETFLLIDKSAGEWSKVIDSSYSGMGKWVNNVGVSLGVVREQALLTQKAIDNIIPSRPEMKKYTNFSASELSDARNAFQRREKGAYADFNPSEQEIKESIAKEKKRLSESEKLAEEWATKKREINASMAIAEQDELAKPFIVLDMKYQEDLIKFKDVSEAKAKLTAEFNAEYQRLALDATTKVEEERLKVIEKTKRENEQTIQKELKLQEENFRIQERQVALLQDEADREVAVATLQYQRTQASLMAQLKMGEVSQTYYDNMMSAEEKLLNKQKESWTVYGQIIKNTTSGMESSFLSFFDSTNAGYMDMGAVAKSILKEMYIEAIRVAMVKPLVGGLTSGLMSIGSSFFGGGSTSLPDASTSIAFNPSEMPMFAHGGTPTGLSSYANQIVSKPTYFAFANGGVPNGGLMGEAGSEAIMPLTRTSNGDLGVSMVGSGGSNVVINIENQTGVNIDLKQLTKSQDDKGNEIRTYVMKFANNDPEFRAAFGISR